MRAEFKNYYGLKRYLTVVAQNNNNDINFDNLDGLSKIYDYLHKHEEKVSYNFNFTDWIKLAVNNDIDEFKRISDIGNSINQNIFNEDIINNIGLRLSIISNSDMDVICTYSRPIMSTNIGCYFIYDNNNDLVYIGKSNSDLLSRSCVSANQRLSGVFNHIELREFKTKAETNIFEIYYISKLKPKFNSESNTKDTLPFDLPQTFISQKYIQSIDKRYFDSNKSSEYDLYRKECIVNGYIIFERQKGHIYRPSIPLK